MADPLAELYQKVVLDHSKSPRNFRRLADATCSGEGHNPACGDRFTIFVKLEGGNIQDIGFQGTGCAISKASASVMTDVVKGKSIEDARAIFQKYLGMLKSDAPEIEIPELRAFTGIRKFPMRLKCATLPWQGLMAALNSVK